MQPKNPNFKESSLTALTSQPLADLLGMYAGEIEAGVLETILIVDNRHLQHDGYVHGGVLATLADTSLAMAAHTLVAENEQVLTIEFKINYLRPAKRGDRLICRGQVLRPGRTITTSEARIVAVDGQGNERVVAVALGTVATVAA